MGRTLGSSAQARVTQEPAVGLLLDPAARRVLAALVQQERALAGVAVELQMPLNSLLYRVRALVAAGLVSVTREVPRSGRPVKWYRAVAESFFIPFAQAPAETPEVLAQQEGERRQLRFIRSLSTAALNYLDIWGLQEWGVRFDLDRQGNLVMEYVVDSEAAPDLLDQRSPAFLSVWTEDLALDFDQAKALQRDLAAVYRKYRRQGGGQRYLLRLSLAPLVSE